MVSIDPRALAGWAALVIAGLLLLVFLYRRRLFILLWTVGWAVTGVSMLLASREYGPHVLGWMVYGLSQFLGIVAALMFVLSADAYRTRPRFRRNYVFILVPMMLWFALAPMLLQATPVFAPGPPDDCRRAGGGRCRPSAAAAPGEDARGRRHRGRRCSRWR